MTEGPEKLVGSIHMSIPEGEEAYSVADEAMGELTRRGIKLPARPTRDRGQFVDDDGVPVMPTNLQDLSDREIGELYVVVQEYYAYVAGQVADTRNRHNEATRKFKFIASKVRLAKDGKQKDKDDKKMADRRYVIADSEAFRLECTYNLLAKVEEAAEADLKLISRNISLREQRLKVGGRGSSIGSRRRLAYDDDKPPKHYTEEDQEPEDQPPAKVRSRKPPRRRPPMRKR
jgi:hypothetical protein